MQNKNGNSRLTWWLMGIVATMIALGMGVWVSEVNSQSHILRSHGEDISALKAQLRGAEERLARIEGKIDDLLSRK